MKPADFILATLEAIPERKIQGRKRLQKLSMLLQFAGADLDAEFSLHHYGPYSSELAEAADDLFVDGLINERKLPVGAYGMRQSEYSLSEPSDLEEKLQEPFDNLLLKLDKFTTIELEMASTIAFFEKEGADRKKAIAEASEIKPTKAIPPVLQKAEAILGTISNQ